MASTCTQATCKLSASALSNAGPRINADLHRTNVLARTPPLSVPSSALLCRGGFPKSLSSSKFLRDSRSGRQQLLVRAQSSSEQQVKVEEKKKEDNVGGEEPVFDTDTSARGRDRGFIGGLIYNNFVSRRLEPW
jgi:hypothetical protein